jgi:hypothetical protein
MKRIFASASVLLVATGCGGLNYKPTQEMSFAQVVAGDCRKGTRTIVTAQVDQAYENTVLLRDSLNPQQTLPVQLGGRNWWRRAKDLVGESRYEVSRKRLADLAQTGTPVNVTLECRGVNTPVAQQISFVDQTGTRVAFDY